MSRQHHIALDRGDIGRYVLMPGDPGRCAPIAAYFDDASQVAANREYTTYTGSLLGELVSVTSTGIGSPSTAIAVEELAAIGADTLIRVGTAGATQNYLRSGDLIVAQGAVRDEGTTRHYVPLAFPAVADLAVVNALVEAAQSQGIGAHTGIVRSTDSLFADLSPHTMPLQTLWKGTPDNVWAQSNVLCSEMEAAALFVISSVRGLRAGCLVSIVNETGAAISSDAASSLDALIRTAVEALRILIRRDRGDGTGR